MLGNFDPYHLARMIIPVAVGLTVHEFAHAWAADRLGDDTARRAGRLTFNPLAHLDLWGTIFLFVSQLFGWAKPVPLNPARLRRPARDLSLVALAGPAINLLTAVGLGLAFKLSYQAGLFERLSPGLTSSLVEVWILTIMVNSTLGFFNLLPLPPLDGFQALAGWLPPSWAALGGRRHYPIFLMIFILLSAGGFFGDLVRPLTRGLMNLILT